MPDTALRFDAAQTTGFRKDSRGFLRSKANLTRVGIFPYQRADGSIVYEYRPEEEVAAAESLATLAGATVTDLHPAEPVTPENARELGRGHVSEGVRMDGDFVSAEVVVDDADLISAIESGDRAEVSCGYSCEIDPTPGLFQGQRYDQIQRKIRYNHAALGPKGWGRAGPQVALRADSNDAIQIDGEAVAEPKSTPEPATEPTQEAMTVKIRLDGGVVEVSEDSAAAFEKAIADRDAAIKTQNERAGAAETKAETEAKRADGLEAERDALQVKLDEAEKSASTVNEAAVKARVALQTSAAKVLGSEEKLDGLSDDEIKAKVLEKARPELKLDSKSSDYVNAAFDLAIADAEKRSDSLKTGRAKVAIAAGEANREDADDVDPYAHRRSAYETFRKEQN